MSNQLHGFRLSESKQDIYRQQGCMYDKEFNEEFLDADLEGTQKRNSTHYLQVIFDSGMSIGAEDGSSGSSRGCHLLQHLFSRFSLSRPPIIIPNCKKNKFA